MLSRRQLIGSGMAVSALGLGGHAVSALEASESLAPPATPYRVTRCFFDARIPTAREIALQSAHRGARLVTLPRDVLELWHDVLVPTRERAAQAFAGVTTENTFFALRTLAADHRMRVLFTEEHFAPTYSEMLYSWVIGPAASRA